MFFSNFVPKPHRFLRYWISKYTLTLKPGFGNTQGQWRILCGGSLCETIDRTDVICVTILGLFLAPFRDKIAAASDHMLFLP